MSYSRKPKSKEEKISWININLSKLLEFSVPSDLVDYICSIKNEKDFNEYFSTLLDFNNPEHIKFLNEVRDLLEVRQNVEKLDPLKSFAAISTNSGTSKQSSTKDITKNLKSINISDKEKQQPDKPQKKTKFINLYSKEGKSKDVILLKGRHTCTCEATKHQLVNNCINCGRIVCTQEGAGPCFFCGFLVCSPDQQAQLDTGSKKSDKLRDYLMKQTIDENAEANKIAIAKRDKLLQYDKSNERYTKVIDDQCDYYVTDSVWMTDEEQMLIKQRETEIKDKMNSRRNQKFTLDFTGRIIIEEQPDLPIDPLEDPVLRKINQSLSINNPGKYQDVEDRDLNPNFDNIGSIEYIETDAKHVELNQNRPTAILDSRIQDKELLEMSDHGMCLSLHQPWASLLVFGLKKHEGRSWYTQHRGTLWIAAAAKQPTEEDIKSEEHFIQSLSGSNQPINFPTTYPVGCLLGCVNLVDCVPQDEYKEIYPNGPSKEPFVFICEQPRRLPICFPMKGKYKIYKLDTKLHQAAKKSLKRIAKLQSQIHED